MLCSDFESRNMSRYKSCSNWSKDAYLNPKNLFLEINNYKNYISAEGFTKSQGYFE